MIIGQLAFEPMFRNIKFVIGCAQLSQLPPSNLPEISFAGRSNVGKSSLLNALAGNKQLARISSTPGRTQQLNFFMLDHKLYIVDMPGYGYARVSKHTKNAWNLLIKKYLQGRPNLRRVFLLIDARHGIKPNDTEIMKLLDETAVNYQIVLTKADKLNQSSQEQIICSVSSMIAGHGAAHPEIILTSADKKIGLNKLRSEILNLC